MSAERICSPPAQEVAAEALRDTQPNVKGATGIAATPAPWPTGPAAQMEFRSTDGGCRMSGRLMRPDRHAFFSRQACGDTPVIARGAGLSFCGASFGCGATSVDMSAFDRLLDFDTATGQVRVEAGITLSALLEVLVRRRRTLAVVPGYGSITVGGCIAADVHGKNTARDGTFISQVVALRLFHPRHGIVTLSPDREPDLFRATCGGYGLTGVILDAILATQDLNLPGVSTSVVEVADVGAAGSCLGTMSADVDFAHSWHDFGRGLGGKGGFGRGHVTIGRLAEAAGAPAAGSLQAPGAGLSHLAILPVGLMNRWTLRAINTAYARRHRGSARPVQQDYARAMFPIHGNELYFRLFGRQGFHEYQAIVPQAAIGAYVERMRRAAVLTGACITLGIAKLFDGAPDLVRFDGRGISIAIELRRDRQSARFLAEMDEALVEAGGRPNPIKDSRLPRRIFEITTPQADRFRAIRAGWDKQRRFRSELSERLAL